MGVIRNAANRKIRGRVGDTTYYVSMDRQIARQALNSSNYGESARRSEAQQNRRVRWSNLVNFYKISKGWMPKAFENKRKGQTDYNRFVSVNVNSASVALTKDQALQGACVVEPFVVSQGSIPSIEIVKQGNAWLTDLNVGDLAITTQTTNAELTAALVALNVRIEEGMQLSFVSYQQSTNSVGVPFVSCSFYEVTLDSKDNTPIRTYLPEFCCQSVGQFLATGTDVSVGAFAYLLSDRRGGTLRVSSQNLINNNDSLIGLFSSEEQFVKAVASYGLDDEVVLSPLSRAANAPTPQPLSINSIFFETKQSTLVAGDEIGSGLDWVANGKVILNMSGLQTNSIAKVSIALGDSSSWYDAKPESISLDGNKIVLTDHAFVAGSSIGELVYAFSVTTTSGEVVYIEFDPKETHE